MLVILGLLTGGVLTGQSLIRAAELRSVGQEWQSFQTAVNTFKGKYFQLPGDMDNATSFFPTAAGNGNNNGFMGLQGAGENAEFFYSWQHLALASLIPGQYTGLRGSTGGNAYHGVGGENVPESKLSGGLWFLNSFNNSGDPNTLFQLGLFPNSFQYGAYRFNLDPNRPILTPQETWQVDKKFDDGYPGRGYLIVRRYAQCTTAVAMANTPADAYTAKYDLTVDTVERALVFRDNF